MKKKSMQASQKPRIIGFNRESEFKTRLNDSICANYDFDSNEIDESDLQFEKRHEYKNSTLHQISINRSDLFENADHTYRVNWEFHPTQSDFKGVKQMI
jgi:hypothetical protein